ncbi:BatA domain-containing protein [Verrucomicrobiota bacterium sgz303538]
MQVIFQNPLWFLGALVAVPLLAHLFSRTRPRRREFPSVKLLREAMRRVTRVRRPRDRWLLIVRTLAMLALILAFLQPWLRSRFAGGSNAAKTVVLAVDLSASMGYADGTRTRLAQATAAAEELLDTLPANSRVSAVWIQAHAVSALPEPGANLDFLRQALRQAAVRPEPGDVAGALNLALKQLGAADGERELVVISDFQKTSWREANLQVPAGIKLTRLAVGEGEAANLGLAGLATEPARPVAGQEARLVCRVRNFSGEPRRTTVFCEAGENRLSQTVEVAPWSETLAAIPVTFPKEGLIPLKATLSEDRFPGDDVRYGLAEVRGALQVGIVAPTDDATARVWQRAAQSLDSIAVRRLSPEELGQARFDILLAAAWNGEAAEALTAHLRQGGALVLQPAPGCTPATVRTLLGLPPGQEGEALLSAQSKDAPGWSLRIAQEEHPIFTLFADGAFGDPVKGYFQRRVATPAFLEAKPLLTYEDNSPALTLLDVPLASRRNAAVAWWNLDLGTSDWSTRTVFVPFFGEFLRYLAQRSTSQTPHSFEPGELLRFDTGAAIDPADVRLADERDQEVKIAPESARMRQRLATVAAVPPGSYRWTAQGSVLDRAVMNFPEIESDLRQLSTVELEQGTGSLITNAGGARLTELREGKPMWPWCLAAAALFFLLEGLLLWRFPSGMEAVPVNAATAEQKKQPTPVTV